MITTARFFIVTFVIYVVTDYIYIYRFLDKYFFFSSSGSKIGAMSRDGPNVLKQLKSFKSRQGLYIAGIVFVLYILMKLLFLNFLKSNFIPIQIFGKVIDMVSFFGDDFTKFIHLYYFAYLIFLVIVSPKLVCLIQKVIQQKKQQDIIPKPQKGILLGKDIEENKIYITKESLYQNLLITGSIGSGKTTGVICNICESLIAKGYGGLILDIKGNFVDYVEKICSTSSRMCDFKVISLTSNYSFNLLDENLSNLELSFVIKQVLTLISPSNNSDSYWLDKVQNVVLNLLVLMQYYNNKKRDIYELHRLVVEEDYLKERLEFCKSKLLEGKDRDSVAFEMQGAILFIKHEYAGLDQRVKSIVKSEITRLTIPLVTEYDIYTKFCKENSNNIQIDFKDKKQIVVLSIDVGKNKMLAQIVAVFLKLQFQREVLINITGNESVFFIADEYQEFVNVEDARFLSLSREARCMNIISTQSYSSIRSVVKDEMATNVIIQNLVNKLWLRNDDNYTIQEIIKQLGKINVKKETIQISESASESKKYLFRSGFKNRKSNVAKSVSQVTNKENEYDENFFSRQLKSFEALSFISKGIEGIEVKKIKLERWRKNEEKETNKMFSNNVGDSTNI